MPITREEFESGGIDRYADVMKILLDNPRVAFSEGELFSIVNFRASESGIRSWRDFLANMNNQRPPITAQQLTVVLQELVGIGAVRRKDVEGTAYVIAGIRSR